jgi:hypothetical protein
MTWHPAKKDLEEATDHLAEVGPEGAHPARSAWWWGRSASPGRHLEREEEDLGREINHLDGSTLSWRRRKTPSEGKP